LRSPLVAAEATIRSAIERRESRGAQLRSDFSDLDPVQRVTIIVRLTEDGTLTTSHGPVQEVPTELKSWLDENEHEVQG